MRGCFSSSHWRLERRFDPLKAGTGTLDHMRNNLQFVKENAVSDERAVAGHYWGFALR
jgi:hypothetical protein